MRGLSTPPIGQTLTDGGGNMTRSWQSWLAQMYQWIKPQPFSDTTYDQLVPTTGFSYTFSNTTGTLLLKPAGTLAAGTLHFPPQPVDGQVVRVSSTQIITALTLSVPAGYTLLSGVSTLAAGGKFAYIFRAGDESWYPY